MTTPTQPTQVFPHHIKISLEIDVVVHKQEDRDYFLKSDGTPTMDYIADVFDGLSDALLSPHSVNSFTLEDIRKELNKRAGI